MARINLRISIIGILILSLNAGAEFNIAGFIDSAQTKAPKIDPAALDNKLQSVKAQSGSGAMFDYYINAKRRAYARPPRIQVDTIEIGRGFDFSQPLKAGEFLANHNAVILTYFLIDPSFKANATGADLAWVNHLEKFNGRMDITFVHERKHAEDYKLIFHGASAIAKEQFMQIDAHGEIAARVAELLYRRGLFLKDKNIDEAFRGEQGCKDYKSYLAEASNIGSVPNAKESQIILAAALQAYKEVIIGGGYCRQSLAFAKKHIAEQDILSNKSRNPDAFGKHIHKIYNFKVDSKDFNLLNAVGQPEAEKFLSTFPTAAACAA